MQGLNMTPFSDMVCGSLCIMQENGKSLCYHLIKKKKKKEVCYVGASWSQYEDISLPTVM